ncbi:MAG: PPOX class F420-dependent oxidoreductase [Nitrospinota bacterium]
MPQAIPDDYKDLFEKTAFGHLATLNPDGSPQNTPVWLEYDGTHILVNSSKGRKKDRNMRRDPRVALSIQDPDNAYRYLEVRGRVVDVAEEGGIDHIHKLAKKYLGKDEYPWLQPGEVRVTYTIAPEHCTFMG